MATLSTPELTVKIIMTGREEGTWTNKGEEGALDIGHDKAVVQKVGMGLGFTVFAGSFVDIYAQQSELYRHFAEDWG